MQEMLKMGSIAEQNVTKHLELGMLFENVLCWYDFELTSSPLLAPFA